MELLDASAMQAVDEAAAGAGLDTFALMSKAGEAVAEGVLELLPECDGPVTVVCGPGNNGGDGAVAAERLRQQGLDIELFSLGHCREDTDAWRAMQAWQGVSRRLEHRLTAVQQERLDRSGVLVDALLGAGLSRPLDGLCLAVVDAMNASPAVVVSVDLPSGLDGNLHVPRPRAVQAALTATFVRYKPTHLLYPGRGLCGELRLSDIGMPDALVQAVATDTWVNCPSLWQQALPAPAADAHKYLRGHVLVRSGSLTRSGAARLSARAAITCGAGAVTLVCPRSASLVNACQLNEVMLAAADTAAEWARCIDNCRAAALVVGPGNGVDEHTREATLAALASRSHCVLDADALTVFKDDLEVLTAAIGSRAGSGSVVLTPHAAEFERLFGVHLPEPGLSRLHKASWAARHTGAVIVFKGPDTIVASPCGKTSIACNAPPWLATAGSGDVLAGVLAALLGQGAPVFEAACMAVWVHAEGARLAGWPLSAGKLIDTTAEALAGIAGFGYRQPAGLT